MFTTSFSDAVAARFSALFAATQVCYLDGGSTPMVINISVDGGETCYDVHPLALWLVVSGLLHANGNAQSLSYYHRNNSCAAVGAYWTGMPLDDAFDRMRRCVYDAKQGWGRYADADPLLEALAALDGWTPTKAQMVALRRGNWSIGFDFDRYCPDLPAHDGWSGKSGTML